MNNLTIPARIFLLLCATPLVSTAEASDISVHVEERVRLTSITNPGLSATDDDRAFLRVRTRLGLTARLGSNVSLGLKLTNEFRDYWKPEEIEFEWDEQNELVFEDLYLRFTPRRWDIAAGKRGYHLGRGMLIMEGGPLDGSRTVHIHGVWITREDRLGTQTLMYLFAPDRERYPEPVWNDDRPMLESDEWALGLLREWRHGHLLYLYKESERRGDHRWKGLHVGDLCLRRTGESARVQIEGAVQIGKQGDADVLAYGGWLSIGAPKPRNRFSWETGYLFLSGDDPGTHDHEGWDPVFARWPMISELYIYTLAAEQGVAYWSNLHGPYAQARLRVAPRLALDLRAYSWWAAEGVRLHRGEDLQLWLRWDLTDEVSGHLLGELLWPGDFHQDDEPARFLRAEVTFAF